MHAQTKLIQATREGTYQPEHEQTQKEARYGHQVASKPRSWIVEHSLHKIFSAASPGGTGAQLQRAPRGLRMDSVVFKRCEAGSQQRRDTNKCEAFPKFVLVQRPARKATKV